MGHHDGGGPVFDQDSFQLHADDGSESASTIISTNTNFNVSVADLDTNIRLRFLIQNTQTGGGSENIQVRFSRNLGLFLPLNSSSTFLRSSLSTHFAEEDDTTQRLGAGTFITPNKGMDEVDGALPTLFFPGLSEVELEVCFVARSVDVVVGDTYIFLLYRANDTLLVQTITRAPTLSIVAAGAVKDPIMGQGIIPFVRP